jgi:hypothetical protein
MAAGAGRNLSADNDDPSTFSMTEARWWAAVTIVIAPIGAEIPTGGLDNSMFNWFIGSRQK